MEYTVTSLPAFYELDDELGDEIEAFIRQGKLNPEDAPLCDGWLVARELGSAALNGCVGFERETDGNTNNIYMQSLVVEKSLRRQNGIGRRLTNELFETVVSPGESLVALTQFWNNGFEKLGFERVDAKEIKAQDTIAGREKYKYYSAWIKRCDIIEQ